MHTQTLSIPHSGIRECAEFSPHTWSLMPGGVELSVLVKDISVSGKNVDTVADQLEGRKFTVTVYPRTDEHCADHSVLLSQDVEDAIEGELHSLIGAALHEHSRYRLDGAYVSVAPIDRNGRFYTEPSDLIERGLL